MVGNENSSRYINDNKITRYFRLPSDNGKQPLRVIDANAVMNFGSNEDVIISQYGIDKLFRDTEDGMCGRKRSVGGSLCVNNQAREQEVDALAKLFVDYEGNDEEDDVVEAAEGEVGYVANISRSCRWDIEDFDTDTIELNSNVYQNADLDNCVSEPDTDVSSKRQKKALGDKDFFNRGFSPESTIVEKRDDEIDLVPIYDTEDEEQSEMHLMGDVMRVVSDMTEAEKVVTGDVSVHVDNPMKLNMRNEVECKAKQRSIYYFSPRFTREMWKLGRGGDDLAIKRSLQRMFFKPQTPSNFSGFMVFPHMIQSHWLFYVVSPIHRQILVYDTKQTGERQAFSKQFVWKIRSDLRGMIQHKWRGIDVGSFEIVFIPCPQTPTLASSGLMMLLFIENMTRPKYNLHGPVHFDEELIDFARVYMAVKLLKGSWNQYWEIVKQEIISSLTKTI